MLVLEVVNEHRPDGDLPVRVASSERMSRLAVPSAVYSRMTYDEEEPNVRDIDAESYLSVTEPIQHKDELPTSAGSAANAPSLRTHALLHTPAVLDLKWGYQEVNQASLFGAAYEDGTVRIYSVRRASAANGSDEGKRESTLVVKEEASLRTGKKDSALALAMDWSDRRGPYSPAQETEEDGNDDEYDEERPSVQLSATNIVVSHSDGSLVLANVHVTDKTDEHEGKAQAIRLEVQSKWKAHDLEAWICAFDYWDPHVIYSGADDALLKFWDARMLPAFDATAVDDGEEELPTSTGAFPTFVSREHKQGVCSIRCHPHNPHILATGSYDEGLRIWDKRNMKSPMHRLKLGGGVWRLKWHPDPRKADYLLAVVMHNGGQIINTRLGLAHSQETSAFETATPEVISEYHQHGPTTLVYGGDWSWHTQEELASLLPGSAPDDAYACLVGTASFYNKRIDLWYPTSGLP